MSEKISYENLIKLLETKKAGDHGWFLSLLDDEKQKVYEEEHMDAVRKYGVAPIYRKSFLKFLDK